MIDYGRTDIDISCRVNDTSIESINIIQLKRSDSNIVSISDVGVSWQDAKLKTRSKGRGDIKDVISSYLNLKIMACDVNQTIDERSYRCALIANGNEDTVVQDSIKVNLNITGIYLIAHLCVIRFANSCTPCSLNYSLETL